MECICTACGQKWSSEELVFNLGRAIRKKIDTLIDEQCDDNEKQIFKKASETFFNIQEKKQSSFFVSEKSLWELPALSVTTNIKTEKYVSYPLPYSKIFQQLDKLIETDMKNQDNGLNKLNDFLKKKQPMLESMNIPLCLRKTGQGNIRFNQILDQETNELFVKKRQCPHCKNDMSFWSGRYQEICLTVLGGPRVSKSTTLTACASAFMHGDSEIVWEGSKEDAAWQSFNDSYLKQYQKGKPLKATNTNEDSIPKITFLVTIKNRGHICLTFLDLPGEWNDHKGIDEAVYKKYKPFYNNINFVWYCTDPGEVRQIEGNAKERAELAELGYEENQNIIRTEEIIENMRSLAAFFQHSNNLVPVAYILGKTDSKLIDEEEKEKYQLYRPEETNTDPLLDVRKFRILSNNVKKYMNKYNASLVRNFESNFKDHCYIAVSAYGYNPKNKPSAECIPRPYNCTLPFLWMLALYNYIEIQTIISRPRFLRPTVYEPMVSCIEDLPANIQELVKHELLT